MKKIMVRLFLVLVVLLVLAAIAVHFFLDDAIKRGVETIGPKLAKVEIKLDAVHLSLLSGSGKLNGLVIGNPEGFNSPPAISVGMPSRPSNPPRSSRTRSLSNPSTYRPRKSPTRLICAPTT